MVDWSNVQLEWSLNNHTSPRLDHNNRCVTERLGGSVPGEAHRGNLDTGGIQFSSHKCLGAESSSFCCEGLPSQSNAASRSPENAQQDGCCLLVEDGGTRSPPLLGIAQELWEYALKQADNTDSRISARRIKPWSRLAVKTFQGFKQLETKSNSFPGIRSPMGSPVNRSVSRSHEYTTWKLYKLVPRPICTGTRCISDPLVGPERLQLPPISQWYVVVWQRSERIRQQLFW